MKNTAHISQLMKPEKILVILAGLLVVTQLFALGTISYLGTFSRHLADDYCESAAVNSEPVLSAVINRFMDGGSNRYSNLLFVGLSELLGENVLQILPGMMLFIWLVGMIWVISRFWKLIEIRLPQILIYLQAISIVFFSVWQAPDRFQTFLWRSGMATHFAPLVFISLFMGFVLSQINAVKKPSPWMYVVVFLASFFLGGFSEPPTTFMIVVILLLLVIFWRFENNEKNRSALILFSFSLAGFLIALLVMFLWLRVFPQGDTASMSLYVAFTRTFRFTYNFLEDSVRTLPLSSLISILISFMVAFIYVLGADNLSLSPDRRRQFWMWLIIAPLVQGLLIAASFAPSAYGESYPAERAQILGRLVMTMTFLFEGALLGVLSAHSRIFLYRRNIYITLSSLILLILAFYPLRAGLSILADVQDYRQWSLAWDVRETEIHEVIAAGERDLVVRLLPTKEGVKEIDGNPRHWVNRCAAQYYEVDTIRSIPMD